MDDNKDVYDVKESLRYILACSLMGSNDKIVLLAMINAHGYDVHRSFGWDLYRQIPLTKLSRLCGIIRPRVEASLSRLSTHGIIDNFFISKQPPSSDEKILCYRIFDNIDIWASNSFEEFIEKKRKYAGELPFPNDEKFIAKWNKYSHTEIASQNFWSGRYDFCLYCKDGEQRHKLARKFRDKFREKGLSVFSEDSEIISKKLQESQKCKDTVVRLKTETNLLIIYDMPTNNHLKSIIWNIIDNRIEAKLPTIFISGEERPSGMKFAYSGSGNDYKVIDKFISICKKKKSFLKADDLIFPKEKKKHFENQIFN